MGGSFRLLFLSCTLAAFTACGQPSGDDVAPAMLPPETCAVEERGFALTRALAPEVERSFEYRVSRILRSSFYRKHPCQQEQPQLKLEMARAVDARLDQIREHLRTSATNGIFDLDRIGPLEVRVVKPGVPRKSGWIETSVSWASLLKLYAEAKKNPGQIANWAKLFQDLTWLVSKTEASLIDYLYDGFPRYMEINRQIGENASHFYAEIIRCAADPDCKEPKLTAEEAAGLARTDYLRGDLRTIYGTTGSERQALADVFHRRYGPLFRFFSETKRNSRVTRQGNSFQLPLLAGFLKGYEKEIETEVRKHWNVLGRTLDIAWSAVNSRDVFEFFFVANTEYRANVNWVDRTINLPPRVRLKSISHEIGHTLGLRDYYYEVYRESTCTVSEQTNADDLMSEPTFGRVLESHWKQLDAAYPVR